MPLTESEQAQYDAMQTALAQAEAALIESKKQKDFLEDKLNRIYDILDEDYGDK